jgi:NADP-dependent aldehyde dehydrogenase
MTLSSIDPRTGTATAIDGADTTSDELDAICRRAAEAAPELAALPLRTRAALLRAAADELEAVRDQIVAVADRETALGQARLNNELTRTCYQLRLFGEVVDEGSFLELTIDHPGELPMGARPDVRRMLVPLGPVAVFGASNFPLAFSVPGGDTASVLAAGCPVVVKVHPAHPETSQLAFECLSRAAATVGAPQGTVATVAGYDAGAALVRHPAITAVGFTGSVHGGRALFDLACARPDPIPFYGELGSINPLVVLPAAAASRHDQISKDYVGSMTLGTGQFCTKPGLAFVPAGYGDEFHSALGAAIEEVAAGWLLTGGIRDAFGRGVARLGEHAGVREIGRGRSEEGNGYSASAALFLVPAEEFLASPDFFTQECFGPVAVVVTYADQAELDAMLRKVPGSLTGTIHGDEADHDLARPLLGRLTERAGRVLWNGYPTGVAVTWAMTHGGPWPSTTASTHTSVGTTAVRRFLRPVTFQSVPDGLLPVELREANELGLPRRVDGRLTLS